MQSLFTTLTSATLMLLNTTLMSQHYDHFTASIYVRAYEVQKMEDPDWLTSTWDHISSQLKVDKIYLETHRDLLIVDEQTLTHAISFFKEQGLEVASGITYTIDEPNLFETFCFTREDHRQKVQEIMEYTARFFDEVILDDFFFTSCKCNHCLIAKGESSWAEYRTRMMTEASTELILNPARAVNPNVEVVIKYPNWYDHFHELGFDLKTQPALFDRLYTGTETRDAVLSNQHLQPYLSYLIFRYFENLAPGRNGGGWVDTGGMRYYDRYAEQLWLTLFAKAPEMTLFDYRQMLYPLRDTWLPEWRNEATSFDYDNFLPHRADATMALTASHALQIIDRVAGALGEPLGIKSYKPFHSDGEAFLQNYLGMIGIPMNIVPEFPEDGVMVILTEQAAKDPDIVKKIQARLMSGKDVMITSGLLDALQQRGIKNLVNLEYTSRKASINRFMINRAIIEGVSSMLIPQITYFTNDSWEIVSGMDDRLGWPLLHMAKVANAVLYVLTIPENFTDLYKLPVEVLNRIRQTACKGMGVTLHGPSMVALFAYDNQTFVVHSFNNEAVEVELVFEDTQNRIFDWVTEARLPVSILPEQRGWGGRVLAPERHAYALTLPARSFKVIRVE